MQEVYNAYRRGQPYKRTDTQTAPEMKEIQNRQATSESRKGSQTQRAANMDKIEDAA
jgi:hypothetical protein